MEEMGVKGKPTNMARHVFSLTPERCLYYCCCCCCYLPKGVGGGTAEPSLSTLWVFSPPPAPKSWRSGPTARRLHPQHLVQGCCLNHL